MDDSYQTFVYAVVRFVPDPMSGERVNLAVIAGHEEEDAWAMKTVPLPTRAKYLTKDSRFAEKAFREVQHLNAQIENYMDGEAISGPYSPSVEWLRYLHDEKKNSITFSSPSVTLATSLSDAIDDLYSDYIVEPTHRDVGGPTVSSARKSIREAYKNVGLEKNDDYREKVPVKFSDEDEDFGRTFDFGVINGHAQQLVQAWNFSKKDQEDLVTDVDAWAWWISQIREERTIAVFNGDVTDLSRDVDFNVVGVPPGNDRPSNAWDKAQMLADQLEVRFVPHTRAREIAEAAQRRL